MIGYGGMMMESFVAIMAMIAATVLDPGVFFAINSPAGAVGAEAIDAVADQIAAGLKEMDGISGEELLRQRRARFLGMGRNL